ncbi:hypothetical protein [Maridesulfovibrio ferrireducens]|uniref:hypothetical protein n=1 Tax=Maridesulfovibrio ferrireducens TaxID=246191 RepID=UPI001A2E8C10|nr:hypothetical protein [Maridesulfovibrio ferrireducens]MBI9113147.1 hypothetical protein [Maridesulfovibrio ferrireducens]
MKIYERVVINMSTMEVLEEDSYEYDGPVALCKGDSNTIDKEYNRRMATIAEAQQDMGQGYYDFWMDNNAGLEKAKISANKELLPLQTQLQKDQMTAQSGLLPLQTEYQKEQLNSNLGLLPLQTDYQKKQLESNLGLLPAQTEAQSSTYGLTTARNNAALGLVPAQTEVANKYYDQAIKGVDIEDRMGKATATVAGQYKDAAKTLTRQSGRRGSNPSSGMLLSAMNDLNMSRAKSTAFAKESTRVGAETENYNRLRGAIGLGLPAAQ